VLRITPDAKSRRRLLRVALGIFYNLCKNAMRLQEWSEQYMVKKAAGNLKDELISQGAAALDF